MIMTRPCRLMNKHNFYPVTALLMAFTVLSLSVLQCNCPQQLPYCQRSTGNLKSFRTREKPNREPADTTAPQRGKKPFSHWYHNQPLAAGRREKGERLIWTTLTFQTGLDPWARESLTGRQLFTEQGPVTPRDTKKGVSCVHLKFLNQSQSRPPRTSHLFLFSRLHELSTRSYQWVSSSLFKVRILPIPSLLSNFRLFSTNSAQADFLSSCAPLSPYTESRRIMHILSLILDSLSGDALRMPLFDGLCLMRPPQV